MDISKSLKYVNNINDYIANTHNIITKSSNYKIEINMSTVLALKKIRSLEIEYFNKCDENGAAFKILDLMLRLPPTKSWSLLGIELISLIQYWLDALRKHLIIHNHHWWNFLNPLLKFIQEIRLKDRSINNILVQETMECLLDLATDPHPDVVQRHIIIQCVNLCCADASREIRFALKNKFKNYFIKLSRMLSSCGDVCVQYGIMETLLRWLLPRQDASVRQEAVAEWFPDTIFPKQCINTFLERPWHNFFKDARDFLNFFNESSDQITSIICKHFLIGSIELITETKKDFWLDLNNGSKCVSLMEPKLLEALGGSATSCDALVICADNVNSVKLHRNRSDLVIDMLVSDPKLMFPVNANLAREVKITVYGEIGLSKIDKALRTIYTDKYMGGTELETTEPHRKRHSGFIVRPMVPVSCQSPSSASTSSLAMLRDKLTAFSGFRYDKETVSVCAAPQLSNVTELSETEDHSFNSSSTLKIRRYGVCYIRKTTCPENRKSQSDDVVVKTSKISRKCISPIAEDEENSVSCLLIATIGSTSDSVINDTLERLPKDKDINTDNIVDLLAQEALQSKGSNLDNKIDTNDKRIEHKLITTEECNKKNDTKQTIISNTTTDESNTDAVEDTPVFMNIRKNYIKNKNQILFKEKEKAKGEKLAFDNQIVEEFFFQHLNENKNRELVISPTLARRINNTSSEASDDFDFLPEVVDTDFNINDIDVIECLNDIVDKVCKNFNKCTKYLDNKIETCANLNMDNFANIVEDEACVSKSSKRQKSPKIPKETCKSKKSLTLKYNNNKRMSQTRGKKKKNIFNKKMSPIIERESAIEKNDQTPIEALQRLDAYDTPLTKRKRKLYSPKDDEVANEKTSENSETVCEDLLSDIKTYDKTPKSTATCYKELENIRKNTKRKIRNKTAQIIALSPKSKKMNDAFDNLKTTIEGEKDVILADRNKYNKASVYNFTSDSEDEDFKIKTIRKRMSLRAPKTTKPIRSRRPNTRSNKRANNVSTPTVIETKPKNNRARHTKGETKNIEECFALIDERMREAVPDFLNVSVIVENHKETNITEEPEPMLSVKPAMEAISDVETVNESVEAAAIKKKRSKKRNKKTNLSLKNKNNGNNIDVLKHQNIRDITESPLPGLVVEAMPFSKDPEDSIIATMLEGFKNSSQDRLRNLSELNSTQNLLSDIEPVNHSLLNLSKRNNPYKEIDHQDRIKVSERPNRKCKTKNAPKVKQQDDVKIEKPQTQYRELRNKKIINLSDNSDSLKTIGTIGKSPITAHGDFEEVPPDYRQLDRRILKQRELEVQDLNKSLKNFYKCLNEEINESSANTNSTDRNNNLETHENSNNLKSKVAMSPNISICRLSHEEIRTWIPERRNSVFESNASSSSNISTHIGKKSNKTVNSIHTNSRKSLTVCDKPSLTEFRKSLISPITQFEDFKPTKYSSSEEDNENRVQITRKCAMGSLKDTNSSESYKIAETNANFKNKLSSLTSKKSTSAKSESLIKTPAKRKIVPDFDKDKRRKVVETVTESAPSVSSVDEWLNKNDQSSSKHVASRDESIELSSKENIESVLEKLDTTLLEINHNTSKKFVSMFLETQKRLSDIKEERKRLWQTAASDLLSHMVKVIDEKFIEIDRRSQEMDEEFMSYLQEQARHLLREDCKQKRVMVKLLKEDVQAVQDHTSKANRMKSP